MVTFDSASAAVPVTSSATISWNHTCFGSNRILIVQVAKDGYGSRSATYGAQTLIDYGNFFYVTAPASGTHLITVTYDLVQPNLSGAAVSYTGAKQSYTGPVGPVIDYNGFPQFTSDFTAFNNAFSAEPLATGDLVVGGVAATNESSVWTPVSGQINRVQSAPTTGSALRMTLADTIIWGPPQDTVTFQWTRIPGGAGYFEGGAIGIKSEQVELVGNIPAISQFTGALTLNNILTGLIHGQSNFQGAFQIDSGYIELAGAIDQAKASLTGVLNMDIFLTGDITTVSRFTGDLQQTGSLPACYNIGQDFTVTVTPGSPADLTYVYEFWDNEVVVTKNMTVTKTLNRGGLLPYHVLAVDAQGLYTECSGSVCVNHPPVILSITISENDKIVPYDTVITVNAVDPEGLPLDYVWNLDGNPIAGGNPLNLTITKASTALFVTVSDPSGGVTTATVELRGKSDVIPTLSPLVMPYTLKLGSINPVEISVLAEDAQFGALSLNWTWEGIPPGTNDSTAILALPDGKIKGVLKKDLTSESAGVKKVVVTAVDAFGGVGTSQGEIVIVNNQSPVITSFTQTPFPNVPAGTIVAFSAVAGDVDDPVLAYLWTFSNGITLTGSSVSFDTTGLKGVQVTGLLTVEDTFGGIAIQPVQAFIVS